MHPTGTDGAHVPGPACHRVLGALRAMERTLVSRGASLPVGGDGRAADSEADSVLGGQGALEKKRQAGVGNTWSGRGHGEHGAALMRRGTSSNC